MNPNHSSTRQRKYKLWQFYLLGTVLTVVTFFAVLELATRLMSWTSDKGFTLALHELDPLDPEITDLYRFHPFTGFTFKPDNDFIGSHPLSAEQAQIHTDPWGFLAKDDRLAIEKPADEIRIAIIGASTAANINLDFEHNWPGQLEALVQRAMPHKRIRVINAAVPGFDTAQSIGNLALRVMPFKPDVVIVYHAYNDMKAVGRDPKAFRADYSHIHPTAYGQYEKPSWFMRLLNHSMLYVRMRNWYREQNMLDELGKAGSDPGRIKTIPIAAEQAFEDHIRELVFIARAGGAKVVLSSFATLHNPHVNYFNAAKPVRVSQLQELEFGSLVHFTPSLTLPAILDGFNRYNGVLKRVAGDLKTGWVDNANTVPHEDQYFVDRVHFSAAGAARMGQNFLPVVLGQLRP